MTEQKKTINKKSRNKKLVLLALVSSLLLIGVLVFLKVNTEEEKPASKPASKKGSYLIAEQGLELYKKDLNTFIATYYDKMLERYEKLSATDKTAFNLEKIVTNRINTFLSEQIDAPETYTDFDLVNGIQPAATISVEKGTQSKEFIISSLGTVGGDKTTVQQAVTIDMDVPTTTVKGKYKAQYAIHAKNKIVVQKASNILGQLAATNPSNITIDGSSCQHGFTGDSYTNKCLNDGNTNPSSFKIMNGEISADFLPTFPNKEIAAIDKQDHNSEALFFAESIKGSKKKAKIYYMRDGELTINPQTLKKFTKDKPFKFSTSEERLKALNIDGVEAYIDISDSTQTLRIDSLNMTGNARLHIVGEGNLKLFIKSPDSTEGRIFAKKAKVSTYLDSKDSVKFSKNFTSAGFIYSKKANMTMMADTYDGNILSGGNRLLIEGGASTLNQLILIPKGNMELTKRVNFKGAIIANSAVINESSVTFAMPKESINAPIKYLEYGDVRHFVVYGDLQKTE